jgi:Spy/CpxP family protein refolding chaperone
MKPTAKVSMKTVTLSLLAATLCFSAMFPISASAEGNGKPGYGHSKQGRPDFANMTPEQKQDWKAKKEAHHQKMMDELGLTPDQASKIKNIREQNHSQAKSIHDQLQDKRRDLMEYMSSDNADPGKAKAMQQEIDQLQNQLSTLRMNTWFEMKKNLTPEQLTKMQALREQHKQNRGPGAFGDNRPMAGFSQGGRPNPKK